MRESIYLVINKRGIDRTCKTDGFSLKPGERAVELIVEVPDACFAPLKVPKLLFRVPPEALTTEFTVAVEMAETGQHEASE